MDNKEKAIEHLLKFNAGHSWFAYELNTPEKWYDGTVSSYKERNYSEVSDGACYASINKEPKEYNFIAIGYYCDKGDSAGKNFLAWVLGDESPWRSLFKGEFELIQSDTHIHGFFISREILKTADQKFLKNFMIATRAFNEFEDHIRLWDYLVQNGVPKDRAFYYASSMILYEGAPYIKHVPNTNHWAWDSVDVDFNAVQTSTPQLKDTRTNAIWGIPTRYGLNHKYEKIKGLVGNNRPSLAAVLKMDKEFKDANCKLS